MKTKTFIIIWVIIIQSIATSLAGEVLWSAFTPEEHAKIDIIVEQAAKEGLFPEILYERINEGIARQVPFEKIFAVTAQKNAEMRELKRFCEESRKSDMPVAWTQRNAEQLLMARQNGLTGQDISFYHRLLAAKKNKTNDFVDILKYASRAQKRGVPREFLKKYALVLADRNVGASGQLPYFALLANAETQMTEVQQKALLQAVTEGRTYRDIERIFKRQKDGEELNRQDRAQGDELRQRIHGAPDRENEQQGKGRKR